MIYIEDLISWIEEVDATDNDPVGEVGIKQQYLLMQPKDRVNFYLNLKQFKVPMLQRGTFVHGGTETSKDVNVFFTGNASIQESSTEPKED